MMKDKFQKQRQQQKKGRASHSKRTTPSLLKRVPRTTIIAITTIICCSIPQQPFFVDGCTTIGVGKRASTDGSVYCSHSNDGEGDTDPRLVVIPASDWPSNVKRSIYYSPESFPRFVGSDRASSLVEAYEPSSIDNSLSFASTTTSKIAAASFKPICFIDQVEHTYRYFEETYGALNEKQLGMAESTCSGVFGAAPKGVTVEGVKGKACFSIDALTQIGMERHDNARKAIEEMGRLAVDMGFYGAGMFEGSAESLIVTDKEEVWVFHILPDPTGTSAIWAAQRVPDDEFVVVANAFIIREIDPNDDENFMYSESVYTVAKDLGWWSSSSSSSSSGNNLLDFTALYSDGEYSNKYYSGRRAWGVFHLFAPSLALSSEYKEWRISKPYPVSAKPDRLIDLKDVVRAMRYFYEDTPYSQAGSSSKLILAGGPWKSPDHVSGGYSTTTTPSDTDTVGGNWERTIGLYRSSDTYISQSRNWLPDSVGGVLWYGAYAAPYTIYTPFAVGIKSLPSVTLGHHMNLDKNTLFWANRYLGNYVQLKWDIMMKEVVAFQDSMLQKNIVLQNTIDQSFISAVKNNSGGNTILDSYNRNAIVIVEETWKLCDHLMFKYADGQVHSTDNNPMGTHTTPRKFDSKGVTQENADIVDKPGYPIDWLNAVGFTTDGPPPPPSCAELGWKCGHRPAGKKIPSSSSMTSNLRERAKQIDNTMTTEMTKAWNVYLKGWYRFQQD